MQDLSSEDVQVQVLSIGSGAVTTHDLEGAAASGARLLAFNVPLAHNSLSLQARTLCARATALQHLTCGTGTLSSCSNGAGSGSRQPASNLHLAQACISAQPPTPLSARR